MNTLEGVLGVEELAAEPVNYKIGQKPLSGRAHRVDRELQLRRHRRSTVDRLDDLSGGRRTR